MSDLPSRLVSALQGRYTLDRELGEGGMATVYLAHDVRHDRKVALKVLRPELAAVVGAERFLAEIRTTANLKHPHILPLFDSGEADSFLFYVMPYVEGESLADRLARERQLPVEEAVRIAVAVANALQHAHDRGIIHRDIKPGNILLQDGEPVVADFGIALAVGAASGNRLTETGLSIGTPYYMSPEQATGDQRIGPASDVYSLACVLYEALVGEPPYLGNSAQAVLGKILQGDPVSATTARKSIPWNVDGAIRRALERLPADRFASAHAFALALTERSFRYGDAPGTTTAAAGWNRLAAALAASTGALALALGWTLLRSEPPAQVIRYALTTSEGQQLLLTQLFGSGLALSPDGARLAYVALDPAGGAQLWLRERDRLEARPLPGTNPAVQPFFSPDGEKVGFVTVDRALKVVSLGGEPPLTLATGVARGGGSWGRDGYVYYVASVGGGIARIPATGGEPEPVTVVDTARGETSHVWPSVLPGGKGVIFSVTGADRGTTIAVAELPAGEHRTLLEGVHAVYATTGHLLVLRSDGALLAAPFDEDELSLTGPATPLLDGVRVGGSGDFDLTLSEGGTLMYQAGGEVEAPDDIVWVTRGGAREEIDPTWTADFSALRLSPSGDRLAVTIRASDGSGQTDVWIKQLERGPLARLTFDGTANFDPSWTPDGERVTFVSNGGGSDGDVYVKRHDGSTAPELVLDLERPIVEPVWTPDGSWLVFTLAGDRRDIYGFRAGGDSAGVPLVAEGRFDEFFPAISPDGRWLAYVSNETGREEVYVRPFPDVGTSRWLVSTRGGTQPKWARGGGELFYKSAGNEMVTVQVTSTPVFAAGEQRVLFDWGDLDNDRWDVAPGDERFLFVRNRAVNSVGQLIVVENFLAELRERLGG